MASFDTGWVWTTEMYLNVNTAVRCAGTMTRTSATNVAVSGTWYVQTGSGYNLNAIYAVVDGKTRWTRVKPYASGAHQTWSTNFSFNQSISGSGSGTLSYNSVFAVYNNAETGSIGAWKYLGFSTTYDSWGTAPSTPTVTVSEVGQDYAKLTVSISSYGDPSSATGRYIEAAILGQNSYGASYRYKHSAAGAISETITVDNDSPASPASFNIIPNKTYWYGGYATNTQLSSSIVTSQLTTLPPDVYDLTCINQTGTSSITATISWYTATAKGLPDGGSLVEHYQYRYSEDGGTTYSSWTEVTPGADGHGTFSIADLPGSTAITVQMKNVTSAGASNVSTLNFVTNVTVKLYGSVSGVAEKITKLYGSIPVLEVSGYLINGGGAVQSFNKTTFNNKVASEPAILTYGEGAPLISIIVNYNYTSGSLVDITFKYSNHIELPIARLTASEWGITLPSDIVPGAITPILLTSSIIGKSKRITKLYGSKDGQTKRIF